MFGNQIRAGCPVINELTGDLYICQDVSKTELKLRVIYKPDTTAEKGEIQDIVTYQKDISDFMFRRCQPNEFLRKWR